MYTSGACKAGTGWNNKPEQYATMAVGMLGAVAACFFELHVVDIVVV